ncbi:MAG: hypothetical protein ACRC3Z_13205 [Phocaeicola sp.]
MDKEQIKRIIEFSFKCKVTRIHTTGAGGVYISLSKKGDFNNISLFPLEVISVRSDDHMLHVNGRYQQTVLEEYMQSCK